MADVARKVTISTDDLLESLRGEWGVGLRAAAQWDDFSDYEQMLFVETWSIPRGYFHLLEDRVRSGEMSAPQLETFMDLHRWIADTRAAIEAVLEDSAI